jgi:hypothetical protein
LLSRPYDALAQTGSTCFSSGAEGNLRNGLTGQMLEAQSCSVT